MINFFVINCKKPVATDATSCNVIWSLTINSSDYRQKFENFVIDTEVKLDVELQVWFFNISDFMQIEDLEVNFLSLRLFEKSIARLVMIRSLCIIVRGFIEDIERISQCRDPELITWFIRFIADDASNYYFG